MSEMSDAAAAEAAELTDHNLEKSIPPEALDGAIKAYPGDKKYWIVALILAVLTLIEVSTYIWDWGPVGTPALLVMMAIKFVIVALFFMHLRMDSRLLSWVFFFGLGLAVIVFITALAAMNWFG